jgi:hypothetical protein
MLVRISCKIAFSIGKSFTLYQLVAKRASVPKFFDPVIAFADIEFKIFKMAKSSVVRFSGRGRSQFLARLYLKTCLVSRLTPFQLDLGESIAETAGHPELNVTAMAIRKLSGFHRCFRGESMEDGGGSHGGW